MQDEYDKLIEFFSYDTSEKEKKLEEIFKKSLDFFERFQHVFASGSEEEKVEMRQKMEVLRAKLKEENEKSRARSGLTSEELKQIASDPKHFTTEQWEFMQRVQQNLAKHKEEQEVKIKSAKEERREELKSKKRKSVTKRSSWMKS